MSVFEKHRFKIFTHVQHPLKHAISDFAYSNNRLPNISTLSDAMDYIVAFLYPNYKGTYANVAALPGTATLNDYVIVTDDGDGKSAGYIWSKIDNVEQWIKRYDVDWSFDSILSETLLSTRPIYVHKWGTTDKDENAADFTGDLAGQRIYGGDTANQHLILYANSGDAAGSTGYVQFGDNARPLVDSTYDFGSATYRWANIFSDSVTSGTMTVAGGSITDTSGSISFGDENLSTTGTLGAGVITASSGSSFGTLTLSNGSITDTGGSISFGDENLSTTGTLASGTHTITPGASQLQLSAGNITSGTGAIAFGNASLSNISTVTANSGDLNLLDVDDIRLDGGNITITTLNTSLNLAANGTGVIDMQSAMTTLGQTVTGTMSVTGQLNADNLRMDGNTLSTTNVDGNIVVAPNGNGIIQVGASIVSDADGSDDLGASGNRFADLWLSSEIRDGTNAFLVTELMTLRSAPYRDLARTQPAQTGDALFYDAGNNIFLASKPDTEIAHSDLSGLTTTDGGHTQFAMLAGRAGGQAIQGGTAASENLDLESTAHATKGSVRVKDNFIAFTNASYSGGWSGTDIGGASNYFRDIYLKGEAKGLRFENYTSGTLPASSSQNVGRVVFATDNNGVYVDSGTSMVKISSLNKFLSDVAFDGIVTTKDVDVSSDISDARNAVKQLLDNSNDFEVLQVTIRATSATNVRIITNVPLPAGSYRLICVE